MMMLLIRKNSLSLERGEERRSRRWAANAIEEEEFKAQYDVTKEGEDKVPPGCYCGEEEEEDLEATLKASWIFHNAIQTELTKAGGI